jgi:hypothetical protein
MRMSKSKRAQVLFEPDAYERLEDIARRQGVSVGELIRRAVEEAFFSSPETRRRALDGIRSMSIPLPDWEELEEEILDAKIPDLFR